MKPETLRKWYDSRQGIYRSLADECGSVAELMLKIEVYGATWTRWDWVMFFYYLDWCANGPEECSVGTLSRWNPSYGWKDVDVSRPEKNLLADIFKTLDGEDTLDAALTNKTVILNFIEWAKQTNERSPSVLRLLAHVFRKYPELWSMNWMFVRHRGKNKRPARTHRLAGYVFPQDKRPDSYFDSDALRDDFVYKYYSERTGNERF